MQLFYINILQAFRHLRHNKGQTAIIVCIISFALTAFVFSASSLWHMTHKENHLPDYRDIYRVQGASPGDLFPYTYYLHDTICCYIRDHAPADVKVGLMNFQRTELKGVTDSVISSGVAMVNAGYFDVLQHEFLHGTGARRKGEIVLTEESALKLYGSSNVVGNSVTVSYLNFDSRETVTCTVCGVIRTDSESALERKFSSLVFHEVESESFMLDMAYSPKNIELFIKAEEPEAIQEMLDGTIRHFKEIERNNYSAFTAVPLRMGELQEKNGSYWNSAFYPTIFLILSTLLLVSAVFSYLALLNTAADSRWTDYRVRLSLGGGGADTLRRLHAEVLLVFAAIGICTFIIMVFTFDIYFEGMEMPKSKVAMWFAGSYFLLILLLLLMCRIPVIVQKYRHKRALNGAPQGRFSVMNYPLAVVQVSVSVLLMFLVWQGGRQIHYISNDALGVEFDNIYTLKTKNYYIDIPEMVQEINACTAIDTCVRCAPIFDRQWSIQYNIEDFDLRLTTIVLDEVTMKMFGMRPHLWKPTGGEFKWKPNQILLSSNAAKYYGVTPDTPYIKLHSRQECEVIGTLDICTRDLHMEPEMIAYQPHMHYNPNGAIYFSIYPGKEGEAFAAVEDVLRRRDMNPDDGSINIVSYGGMVSDYYRAEQNYLYLYSILSLIGFGIALFGLLTLVSADLQRRRRSLAIRRVFGAYYRHCFRSTLKTYITITALGTIIALCIGYWLMTLWLQTYSDHITLGWLPALGITIAILAVVMAVVARKVRACFIETPTTVIKN